MKKVLLLDPSIATINTGDEIIKVSIERNFPELFETNYIYRLPTHTHTFSKLQLMLYPNKKHQFQSADYTFLCGTNALYVNMLRPMPTWNINFWNSTLLKNVICLGVGCGQNSTKANSYTKRLYRKVLSKDVIHSVRDEYTETFLCEMGFKALNTGCPTLWGFTPEKCRTINNVKNNNVIFTLTNYTPDIQNDVAMIDILFRNYENVYFWPQSISDLDYLESITDKRPHIIAPNLNKYDEILTSKIDYVGNRLHGGIFSMQHGNRSIIISIDNRARHMKESYDLPIIERNNIQEELEPLINSTWNTELTINFQTIKTWKDQFEF